MVRQIALDFLFKQTKTKLVPEKDEIAQAMAFILAESNRKAKAKLKFLTPITVPFWIVQTSDTNSIVLSSIGESSVLRDEIDRSLCVFCPTLYYGMNVLRQ